MTSADVRGAACNSVMIGLFEELFRATDYPQLVPNSSADMVERRHGNAIA
jgi:hypothetical protein